MTEHRRKFIQAFEAFQAEFDKSTVEIVEGGEMKIRDGKIVVVGGIVKRMSYGIYRKLFRERE